MCPMSFSLQLFDGNRKNVAIAEAPDDLPYTLPMFETQANNEISMEMEGVVRDIRGALTAMRALIRYERRGEHESVLHACRSVTRSYIQMLLRLDESITLSQQEIFRIHTDTWPDEDQPVAHSIPAKEIAEIVRNSIPIGSVEEHIDTDALEEMHNAICKVMEFEIIKPEYAPRASEQLWYSNHNGNDTDPDGNNTHAPAIARAA